MNAEEFDEHLDHIDSASRDAVPQIVTAILHNDKLTSVEIMAERCQTESDAIAMAVTATNLVAYVHLKWARCMKMPHAEALATWASIAGEIAEHRETGQ